MYTTTIKIQDATPGMKLAESVYIVTGTGTNMLAARKGMALDPTTIAMLTRRGIQSIEIITDERPPEESIASAMPQQPSPPPQLKPLPQMQPTTPPSSPAKKELPPDNVAPIRTLVDDKLKVEAVDSIKQLFTCFSQEGGINKTTAYKCVNDVEKVVDDLLGVITSDSTGLVHINDLKQFDEYTYHHSLSVSMLSIATGKALGLNSDELFRLGRCAMLHDIGKQLIPHDIINKKGKLTDAEFTTIKNHPVLGASTLKTNAMGDVELWNGIMFHHEKVNGSGYPKGLKGKDIPIFSKIISVSDVYDAITSYRSYRSPMLPSEAFNIISKDIGVSFEYDVVRAFFATVELYPENTVLELSDGRLGIVVGRGNGLRPDVRIWGSTEIVHLASSSHQLVEIEGVMHPDDLPNNFALG